MDIKLRLRPDGFHFLLINLHQMVALPLTFSKYTNPEMSNIFIKELREIKEDIRQDALAILSHAAKHSGDDGISGHAVLNALSEVYGSLQTTKVNIWG